jgi:hypothetical protein
MVEVQDTPLRAPPVAPGGIAIRCSDGREPRKRSASSLCWCVLSVKLPTTTQPRDDAHETPSSATAVAPGGLAIR